MTKKQRNPGYKRENTEHFVPEMESDITEAVQGGSLHKGKGRVHCIEATEEPIYIGDGKAAEKHPRNQTTQTDGNIKESQRKHLFHLKG